MSTTAYLLQRARLLAGLSTREAARRAGVHQQQVSRWELGWREEPGCSSLRKLAKVYGLPVEELIGNEPPAPMEGRIVFTLKK